MIHLIYIYFIVNAYIAGKCEGTLFNHIINALFGAPWLLIYALYKILENIAWRLNSRFFFISMFRLKYTDRYRRERIDMSRAVMLYRTGNKYARRFIRALDKKYGYGITKGDPEP